MPLSLYLLLSSIAGAEPVSASAEVPCAPEAVIAWLSDPVRALRLSPDVASASLVSQGGDGCSTLDVEARSPLSLLRYRILRCPTATGYTERLLVGDDFLSNDASWVVVATPTGSHVRLTIAVETNLPVPGALVDRATLRSARATMAHLVEHLTAL